GGYSTADGFIARVSIADRNLLGRGQFAKASVSYGQYSQGFDLSFVEPYLLGYRMAGGIDVFGKQNQSTSFVSYNSNTLGVNLRLGFALTEELALQPHYSIYRQDISLPDQNNCYPASSTCYPASLPVRLELAILQPTQDVSTLTGLGPVPTTPAAGVLLQVLPDVVGVLKLQGGNVAGWGGDDLRMLDHFFMGPNLVRGFAPSGIGPRDLTSGTTNDALGGSLYWGASLEFQTPLTFLPREIGIKLAAYADAGNLWDYQGPTAGSAPPGTPYQSVLVGLDGASDIRSSVGVGLIWDSPLGPLRFDLAYPLTKYCSTLGGTQVCDKTQIFRFSGGTKF
ncbi:MAG: BamA/TamA family outer membrane protein, partial [Pseudolabrys sp.]